MGKVGRAEGADAAIELSGSYRALHEAVERQMTQGETTFIEVLLNQELGEPFRRDAMKKPVVVAGIDPADMRPQKGAA